MQTMTDADLLASFEDKTQIIRDCVRGVAEGYSSGLFLWGEPGTSKSYTVEETLKQLGTSYKVTNTHLSTKGLVNLLYEQPDVVHVLEDAETLFRDRASFGVLRSCLWGQTGRDGVQERVVCWKTDRQPREFVFTGGLIIISNRAPDDNAEFRAIKTRIPCLRYQPTNEEIEAIMRAIASKGYTYGPHTLSPEKSLDVAKEITVRSRRMNRNLDIRLLVNAFMVRLQWENGAAETHWTELLESQMTERVVARPAKVGVRAAQKANEMNLLRQIAGLPTAERLGRWKSETGKSMPAMYRRLAELGQSDSQFLQFQDPLKIVSAKRDVTSGGPISAE